MEPVQARLEVWMSRPGLVRSAIGLQGKRRGERTCSAWVHRIRDSLCRTGFAFMWFAMRDDDKTLQGGLTCRVQGWRSPLR